MVKHNEVLVLYWYFVWYFTELNVHSRSESYPNTDTSPLAAKGRVKRRTVFMVWFDLSRNTFLPQQAEQFGPSVSCRFRKKKKKIGEHWTCVPLNINTCPVEFNLLLIQYFNSKLISHVMYRVLTRQNSVSYSFSSLRVSIRGRRVYINSRPKLRNRTDLLYYTPPFRHLFIEPTPHVTRTHHGRWRIPWTGPSECVSRALGRQLCLFTAWPIRAKIRYLGLSRKYMQHDLSVSSASRERRRDFGASLFGGEGS